MRKKLTIFGLSLALILSMILLSVGQQPMILPGFNLNDVMDVNVPSPTDTHVLTYDASIRKWKSAAGGGGGTPGGSDRQVQYNDSDSFGGSSNFTLASDGEVYSVSNYGTMQTATGDGTTTIDWGLGNYMYFTFGAQNDAFTFTPPANKGRCLLWIKQDATGNRTMNWGGVTILWPGGVEPTLSTGANDVDMIGLAWDGTSWHGLFNGDFS